MKGLPAMSNVTSDPKPAARERRQPLPPPTAGYNIQTRPSDVATTSTSGGSRGLASYNPPVRQPEVTGSVQAPQTQAPQNVAAAPKRNWSWDGGTVVTVAPGETALTLERRFGVPASAIVQANNLPDAAAVKPGQRDRKSVV